jgi:uncharacterized protein DUF4190
MARDDRRDRDDDDRDEPRRPARRRPRDEEPDDFDDAPADRPRKKARRGDGEGVAKIIPYRNGPALAAYYCGVFALIPGIGFVLGPIAFILGIVGLVKARKSPKAHGTGHAITGIILGLIAPPLWIVLWYFVFEKLTNPNPG